MRSGIYFIILFCFFTISNIHAQLSTKHYIPPITGHQNDLPKETYIYISSPKNNVAFTVTPVGFPNKIFSGVVSNNSPFVYRIVEDGEDPSNPIAILDEDGDTQFTAPSNLSNTIIKDRGYIIEATDVIYVSIRFDAVSGYQAGALVSKGLSGLGKVFRVGAFVRQGVLGNGFLNFASIMATEDNTKVTFGDFSNSIAIVNHTGNTPIQTILQEGESYFIAVQAGVNSGDPNDIVGSLIESDKPIVVNTGSITGSFSTGTGGRDYGVDQIVDFNKVGNEYIFIRGNGGNSPIGDEWENVLLVAHIDKTEIFINNNQKIATINAGEYYVIEGDSYTNENLYVKTSQSVFAYQGIGGNPNSKANQGMFFVPPLSCENKGNVDNIAAIDKIGNTDFSGGITVVSEKGATILVNKQPINSFNTIGPTSVDGNTKYETYKVNGLTGNVSVESTGELYCAYFNRSGFATSGSFYSGFPSPPEINFNATVVTLGNCIPNVKLEALNTSAFDTFEWYYDSGNGFQPTGNITAKFTPTNPGNYKLRGVINCSNAVFESAIVPVSICPDDADNDLIIDNVDIDTDNDGILNCDESRGDVTINLTDINIPVLNFLDNSTDNSFVTTKIISNGTSTLTGDITGNFTTSIEPALNSDVSYELSFSKPSHIEYSQNTAITHTNVAGENFSLTITPNNKNITLIDPDNILLVDTNFDGVYESNINNYNATEIRFQINPTPKGTTPFKIAGNSIDKITFKHTLSNVSNASSFAGNIKLTCFAKDSDGDGIEDALDLDSDNDGIKDFDEFAGQKISLTGNDTNLDGLDDVFNNLTISDFDKDGIPDYLDVDSDNDGIYDSTEAGHNLDANLDGVIDNPIVGTNGLVNSLETTANSGILKTPTSDINGDNRINSVDLDADGDRCFDVIEAGFLDPNNDNIIGPSPVQVDANGKVINIPDGYTAPNLNYITIAPIDLNTPFENVTFCEASTSTITIDSTADVFQWEVSTDNGTNWSTINDNAIYNGSITKDLQITNIPLTYNNYQFRVKQNRSGNSCENTSTSIVLTVNPLPIIKDNSVIIKQCIDTQNSTSTTLNLTLSQISISDNPNGTFEYYEDQAGTNLIVNPTNYDVVFNQPKNVWVKTISEFGCAGVLTELIINVAQTPNNPYSNIFPPECDDFLDTQGNNTPGNNSDIDQITNFPKSSFDEAIIGISAPANTTLSFYESQNDRDISLNPINISNYRNNISKIRADGALIDTSTGIRFPIYYKILSTLNNDCEGFGEFFLQIDSVPTAQNVSDLVLCDDATDGSNINGFMQSFNLESQTSTILGNQNNPNLSVTYHLSSADANSGLNLQTSPFTNTVKDKQTVYVRVTNTNGGCFTDHTSFDVIVNPVPVANFVPNLEICDDNTDGSARNGFSQSIDLTSRTAGILGNQDPTQFGVSYHTSLANAQGNINPLLSPYSNTVADRQTIYVRVFNQTTQCANGISNFDVIINKEPLANPDSTLSNLSLCDNDNDGDDTNGLIDTIDLTVQIPTILGTTQDEDVFNVTFHSNQTDATSGSNPLPLFYTNSTPTETIFVRIENKATGCVNDDLTFQLIINPLPDFQVTTPQIVCLNNPPVNLTVENPRAIYNYKWSKVSDGTTLSTTDNVDVFSGGSYKVIATDLVTGCIRERTVEVTESNIAEIKDEDITIIDDSDNNSIKINTGNQNLGIGSYEYALIDESGNTYRNYQYDPFFDQLVGGIYTILVRDKNGCDINGVPVKLSISVVEFPKFFSPNNDGINDTWGIKGANSTFYPTSKIYIFNRFGKAVAEVPIDGRGWDGTYNGKTLPSDDYWFSIMLVDKSGNARERKGNFSLLRK
ncbi:gliding motility-associated-like protein [Lutibacter sp. Hel_I_33_5]|uniref:T9SS type B sorting domain-containing protein n=1 Tax=Lutibacter sp. Hel_I_33_5 TaxID=1566289 RepID=UPI0011AA3ACE|nr:T9SS type B sorting domain-containing protein [Lutibacter sp. Hel_I_33_5]TVZ55466.1 gliding motility-associated-like protein [Lutibacter sp. Hel_I_33_5]